MTDAGPQLVVAVTLRSSQSRTCFINKVKRRTAILNVENEEDRNRGGTGSGWSIWVHGEAIY